MIKIIITDDHPMIRAGLASILQTQSDMLVLAELPNGKVLMEQINELNADVLLLDLEMPEMDGLQVIQACKEQALPIKIIVFTAYDTDERIIKAIKSGAKGYLLKGASRQSIYDAIRAVHAGQSILQAEITEKLFRQISSNFTSLTERELEVIQLIANGLKNKDIADQLYVSERTIKFHVSSILSKLSAKNRTEAVKIAREKGII